LLQDTSDTEQKHSISMSDVYLRPHRAAMAMLYCSLGKSLQATRKTTIESAATNHRKHSLPRAQGATEDRREMRARSGLQKMLFDADRNLHQ
jgi:uncharacterized membrane protein